MVEQSANSWFAVGSIPNLADLVVLVALRSLEVQKAIRGDNQCCHGACRYGVMVSQEIANLSNE